MGLAVELLFDAESEQRVYQLRQTILESGIQVRTQSFKGRPHISIAILPNNDINFVRTQIEAFAQNTASFGLNLSTIGLFGEGVLFLSPTPTQRLLEYHRRFHLAFATTPEAFLPVSQPDAWIPHCTVAKGLKKEQLVAAINVCIRAFKPFSIECCAIGLVQFNPGRFIQRYPLGGS